MPISPPFTALKVRKAASGFYKGNSLEIVLVSKAILIALVIWALVWFSTSHKIGGRVSKPANDAEPLPLTPATVPVPDVVGEQSDPVVDWCRAFEAKHGRKPQIPELQAAFSNIAKTTAWRRIKAA